MTTWSLYLHAIGFLRVFKTEPSGIQIVASQETVDAEISFPPGRSHAVPVYHGSCRGYKLRAEHDDYVNQSLMGMARRLGFLDELMLGAH